VTRLDPIVDESIVIPAVTFVVARVLAPVPPVIFIVRKADRPTVVATELLETPASVIAGLTTTVST
jgi:hypothetical protein